MLPACPHGGTDVIETFAPLSALDPNWKEKSTTISNSARRANKCFLSVCILLTVLSLAGISPRAFELTESKEALEAQATFRNQHFATVVLKGRIFVGALFA